MRSCAALVLLVVLLPLAPRAAGADHEDPCPRPRAIADEEARSLYADGERFYAAGRYGESVAAFSAALARSGKSELYFALANAHERMGHLAEAAQLLERYLRCARPADAGLVGERLRRLRWSAARLERLACPVDERPDRAGTQPIERVVASEPADTAAPPRAWPWLVAGGGALAAALGLAIAADAARPPPCASPEQGRACVSMPIDPSAALGRAAIVSAAVGTFALTAGAVIAWRGRSVRSADRRSAMPWLAPGVIGVAWVGSM